MRRVLVVVSLLGLVACGESAGAARGGPPGSATVTSVVDGDTIHARIGRSDETVRLIGIDTPETHKPGTAVECFGKESTAALGRLLPKGTRVILERDVEARDRYGRLLAYVYRTEDRVLVNVEMARTGFAAAYTYPPNVAHTDEIVAAAAEARDAGRGLWSACGDAHVAA